MLISRAMTPLQQQHLRIIKRFPDTIVLFRLGDFYETFDFDLAERVANREQET